jgi:hypothetical protein
VPVEEGLQHRPLAAGQRPFLPGYLRCGPGHPTIMSLR